MNNQHPALCRLCILWLLSCLLLAAGCRAPAGTLQPTVTASPAAAGTAISTAALTAAVTVTPMPTAAVTDTPVPTATAVPTATPTATPAPAVTIPCDELVPPSACACLQSLAAANAQRVRELAGEMARLQLGEASAPASVAAGAWTYVVAAPFYTLDDEVTTAGLIAAWQGRPEGALAAHPLLVSPATLRVLETLWGQAAGSVRTAEGDDLLAEAQQLDAWAIIPFDELQPGWKVLRLNGISPLEKGMQGYPLQAPLVLSCPDHPEALPALAAALGTISNRDEGNMTIVAMTGVTALARLTAVVMERVGILYPARDIAGWLQSADITHISNECAFAADAELNTDPYALTFLSHDRYIELLEAVGTDVVELTGNHLNDFGREPLRHTLELYRERGWQYYGGGANLAEATRPLLIEHGPNRIAFLGCNPEGPVSDWATETEPGSAPADYERLAEQIRSLRDQGYLPIVTIQYKEEYQYAPLPQQVETFRWLARAGAVAVLGSQAHQPQAMEIHNGAFVHYGLGNFFFDQMWSLGTRQEFIDRLVFYDGRLLSVDLRTAMLEEYARPRPMTLEERRDLLRTVFAARP